MHRFEYLAMWSRLSIRPSNALSRIICVFIVDAFHSSLPGIESVIVPKLACTSGEEGNPHYAEQLQMDGEQINGTTRADPLVSRN